MCKFQLISINLITYREKNYHDNMYKMQCGDLDVFRNFFVFGSPKFVAPVPPQPSTNQDSSPEDYSKDPMEHQTQVIISHIIHLF